MTTTVSFVLFTSQRLTSLEVRRMSDTIYSLTKTFLLHSRILMITSILWIHGDRDIKFLVTNRKCPLITSYLLTFTFNDSGKVIEIFSFSTRHIQLNLDHIFSRITLEQKSKKGSSPHSDFQLRSLMFLQQVPSCLDMCLYLNSVQSKIEKKSILTF